MDAIYTTAGKPPAKQTRAPAARRQSRQSAVQNSQNGYWNSASTAGFAEGESPYHGNHGNSRRKGSFNYNSRDSKEVEYQLSQHAKCRTQSVVKYRQPPGLTKVKEPNYPVESISIYSTTSSEEDSGQSSRFKGTQVFFSGSLLYNYEESGARHHAHARSKENYRNFGESALKSGPPTTGRIPVPQFL